MPFPKTLAHNSKPCNPIESPAMATGSSPNSNDGSHGDGQQQLYVSLKMENSKLTPDLTPYVSGSWATKALPMQLESAASMWDLGFFVPPNDETPNFKFLLKPKSGDGPCMVEEGPSRMLTGGGLIGGTTPAVFRMGGDEVLEIGVFIQAAILSRWRVYLEEQVHPSRVPGVPDVSMNAVVSSGGLEAAEIPIQSHYRYMYPNMSKTLGSFKLEVTEGHATNSEIVLVLGESGTGKTTFLRMLLGLLKPHVLEVEASEFNVSYKPQNLRPVFQSTVRNLLLQKVTKSQMHDQFMFDVMKPLQIEKLMDRKVVDLSEGESQRVALCVCLGKKADIYLIDEPSAYLDTEDQIAAAGVINKFIRRTKRSAFVADSKFEMAMLIDANRIIVCEGIPSKICIANAPVSLTSGFNRFLTLRETGYRRDPRPRTKHSYYLDD